MEREGLRIVARVTEQPTTCGALRRHKDRQKPKQLSSSQIAWLKGNIDIEYFNHE
jgi:hypothetical protein